MSAISASDRFRRIVSIVPWIASHDGPHLDEVCARFGIDRAQLLADLDVVLMVGLYPYTPDELVEVIIDDDRVWIRYADFLRRPLRLTSSQGLALLAAGAGLLAVPGADPDGPLGRGLRKLAAVLGVDPDEAIDVELGEVDRETLEALTAAARDRHPVEIDYYAYGRDEHSTRVIEPARVYADQGAWYVSAWCRRAEGERIFRIDRIERWRVLDEDFDERPDPTSLGVFQPSDDDPRVVLELMPGARWVPEQYPVEDVTELGEGRRQVTLAVTATAWLERLLLRLGPDARVVGGDPALAACGRQAATRVLARYRTG